ncbi:MAG TPA: hypothetical protein VNK03_06815 [Gammaproteobacteria bacterium]|nr:hypothetical protein [Gammaproteobacteria bacterium]
MRLCKFISFSVSMCLLSGFLFANDIPKDMQVAIKMVGIAVEKAANKDIDNLFFNITQYSNLKKGGEHRIPKYPKHWLSKQLPGLKNVVLWDGKIDRGESLKLILSLMEQDFPPWDLDDAIGAAEVILLNQNGHLKIQWGVPNEKNNQEVEMLKRGVPQGYIFKGTGSRYDVAFSVEQK